MAYAVFLLRRALCLCNRLGVLVLIYSGSVFANISINLPEVPQTGCGSGAFACANPVAPKINDVIDTVVVTAKRLDPITGLPISAPTPNIDTHIPASSGCGFVPSGFTTSGTGAACVLVAPSTYSPPDAFTIGSACAGYVNSCASATMSDALADCQANFANITNYTVSGNQYDCKTNAGVHVGFVYKTKVCGPGYIVNGGSNGCNLSNSSLVPRPTDGHCNVVRSGNAYANDANDADCIANGAAATSPAKVEKKGVDAGTKVTPNADGTTTVTYNSYNYSSNTTTSTTVVYDGSGKVTGVNTAVLNGIGDAASSTPQPTTGGGSATSGASSADVAGTTAAVSAAAAQAHSDAVDAKAVADAIKDDLKPSTNTGAPAQPSSLYTPTGKTFSGVLNSFVTSVQQQPFYSAASNFFTVTLPGGNCPVWSAHVWVFQITFDQQCSAAMQNIWPFISAMVIACAAFLAFRWAFL